MSCSFNCPLIVFIHWLYFKCTFTSGLGLTWSHFSSAVCECRSSVWIPDGCKERIVWGGKKLPPYWIKPSHFLCLSLRSAPHSPYKAMVFAWGNGLPCQYGSKRLVLLTFFNCCRITVGKLSVTVFSGQDFAKRTVYFSLLLFMNEAFLLSVSFFFFCVWSCTFSKSATHVIRGYNKSRS